MDEKQIKIRELKRKDRKTLAAMIKKMVDKIGDQRILNLMVTETSDNVQSNKAEPNQPKDQFSKIGIEIIKLLMETLEEEVSVWFADLLGVTIEQLDDMPVDIELVVIDQLISAPEANRFFTSASLLFKRTRELAGQWSGQKKA
jgi:hypothetical protein